MNDLDHALVESLTEESLILRLYSTEHDFVERKSRSDKSGWLQTAVAFANSAPIGWPAILFVGVDDDGKPQQNADKLEDLMKSVSGVLERTYPPIYRNVVPVHAEGGACLAVIVPGSEARPHFAGLSYVRYGTQTKEASETQYDLLIAQRNSKARMILEARGKPVTLETRTLRNSSGWPTVPAIIEDCNQFFVTVRFETASPQSFSSIPLAWVELTLDHQFNRLKLIYWNP